MAPLALIAPALAAIGSIASVGIGIAGAAGAFDKGGGGVPDRGSAEVEDARRRALARARAGVSSRATRLTKAGEGDPLVHIPRLGGGGTIGSPGGPQPAAG